MDRPASASAPPLTSGTATLLFTDIEGSTRLLAALGPAYAGLLETHRSAIRMAVARAEGRELGTEGDSFFVLFRSAARAVEATVEAQRALAAESWPEGVAVRVRMGLHTGEVTVVQDNVVGLDVHRAARISAAAHGGQVLVSDTTRSLVEQSLPAGVTLRDLGEHRLKDMARPERLYQLVIDGLPDAFPPLRTLEAVPNNLPLQRTSLVGRGVEIAAVAALVRAHRIVTLTGPGGTGKTRLGLAVAADLMGDFPDGAWFVPLAPITNADLVPTAISQALAVPESGSLTPFQRLAAHLQARKLLLVLDNFEQVVSAAPVLGELLQAAPDVRMLVTSRAVLYVYGEHEFPVPPLSTPATDDRTSLDALAQFGAVQLFVERAVTARPDFALTADTAPIVAQICTRLDGLPLAIELAAARIRLLTPAAILVRLQHRLSLLDSGSRDLPARQQTLRGAIAWSYDLLDSAQQRLFARFGAFVGGATIEDAEIVCGPSSELGGLEVFDGLGTLLDQSLLRREDSDEEPRLEMLETIREFALEMLAAGGDRDQIEERHAMRFLLFAEEAGPHMTAHDRTLWLNRVERELPNVRAALDWLITTDHAAEALRLVAAFWRYWQIRLLLEEGRDRVNRVLALAGAEDHPHERAAAIGVAGSIAYWMGDSARARAHYDDALRIARELDDQALIAEGLYNRAWPRVIDQEYPEALVEFGESLERFTRLGDLAGQAKVLWGLGSAELYSGDLDAAERDLSESVLRFRTLDDLFGLGWALHNYGHFALLQGDYPTADARLMEALLIFEDADDFSGMALVVDRIAELAAAEGDTVTALRLAGAAAAFQSRTGAGIGEAVQRLGGARPVDLSDREAEAAWSDGQRLSIRQAVEEARTRRHVPA